MKATGIVRRIDDLGRIVVPKEIRRNLRIREGDSLEIYTAKEGEIVLKKYSPMGEIRLFASQYADSLAAFVDHLVVITDRDSVLAVSGGKKELLEKSITKEFEQCLEKRTLIKENTKNLKITDNDNNLVQKAISPIICEGDIIGGIVMIARDETGKISETDAKLLAVASNFLGRHVSN